MSHKQHIDGSSIDQFGLSATDYAQLVPGGRDHFLANVQDHAQQLFNEARNIEEMEHTGPGQPEITAAHVEEAKWVLVRRQRRRARGTRLIFPLRAGQAVTTALVGIGASNFDQTWGALLCIGAVFLGSMLLLVEREFTREL